MNLCSLIQLKKGEHYNINHVYKDNNHKYKAVVPIFKSENAEECLDFL